MVRRLVCVALLGACLALCAAAADVQKLEVTASKSQLTFLLDNTLYTMQPDATVGQLVDAVRDTLGACVVVHRVSMAEVATTSALRPYFSVSSDAALQCGDDVFEFHTFRPWQPPVSRKLFRSAQKDYPLALVDLLYNTFDADIAWVWAFLSSHWGPLHPFNNYTDSPLTGLYHLQGGKVLHKPLRGREATGNGDDVLIGLAADWGSGCKESALVAKFLSGFNPQYTINLGDLYYTGRVAEVQAHALGIPPKGIKHGVKWPLGSVGGFWAQGNHEMYSRGFGYFDHLLPAMGIRGTDGSPQGQHASYFGLENDYWRVIALDTGYNTYSPALHSRENRQPEAVIDWLRNVVQLGAADDSRGIVLLSHHQYISGFEEPYLLTPEQIQSVVGRNRTVLWLWGHEHRLAFYSPGTGASNMTLNAYGRCIGVGGFPVSHSAKTPKTPPFARKAKLELFDNRVYEIEDGNWKVPVGYNGFTMMKLSGPELQLDYHSLKLDKAGGSVSESESELLVSEVFSLDDVGNVQMTGRKVFNPDLTVVKNL